MGKLVLVGYYNQDIMKTRNTSYGFTKTRQKDHGKLLLCGEGENEHTLLDGGHVQVAMCDPEALMKSSLSDCTWLE